MNAPDTARRPLVGISTYSTQAAWGVWRQQAALLPSTYVEAVTRAGALAVLLPPQPAGALEAVAALDALVVSGGPDVDPARYGEPAHPRTDPPDVLRDAWEFDLLHAALTRDLPVLGVCRGMQVLNAALGGTLEQHLPDRLTGRVHRDPPGRFARTRVNVRPGSRLAGIVGESAEVSCYHHQAVARLGAGLVATAWSTDETVEAVELPGRRFVLGVQWHPENDTEDIRLFRALTEAGARGSGRRGADRREVRGAAADRGPVGHTEPADPAGKIEPAGRTERVDPAGPAETTRRVDPAEPAERTEPAGTAEPAGRTRHAESAGRAGRQPADPAGSHPTAPHRDRADRRKADR
ncbi:gamma-glutamyl-gamma-aminobutyrate hydrolase family protein [Actinacidiphila guanduensis]|uniref:Gamma-glutamyl-gamma-aminobutyrate hydrolase PuuD (Putrescine degradation), contains GATase1-like domain n=1 Tax=Actinacidiphila guanduensis TaxID=310781 RepID=A0A1H0KIF3_9ACTN|nr:gamma-glutamyl-gamma-aminobutyrate hydrolase family protein [Actinacidiphila guanduensis]SDO55492.1 Gamma-glutamyl-gamma-aminobutyrate hydrolase PuuD (putrescine degradation), contains GATase1-like domain [Actinacidiphila guanduensis]